MICFPIGTIQERLIQYLCALLHLRKACFLEQVVPCQNKSDNKMRDYF